MDLEAVEIGNGFSLRSHKRTGRTKSIVLLKSKINLPPKPSLPHSGKLQVTEEGCCMVFSYAYTGNWLNKKELKLFREGFLFS